MKIDRIKETSIVSPESCDSESSLSLLAPSRTNRVQPGGLDQSSASRPTASAN